MKAGPKAALSGRPLHLHSLPGSGGDRAAAFVERYCRLPKGPHAREPVRLRSWQRAILHGLFDDPRPRQALVTVARKNGKTLLAAVVALYKLLGDAEEGAEALVVAADERQARVCFNLARRMVELDRRLAGVCQLYADRIVHPASDSVLEPLPAEADRLQGRNPSLAVVDELHVVSADVWDAMALAGGTRARPLTLGISTAGADRDSVMRRLVEHGRAGDDAEFFFAEWAAPDGCDVDDEDAWAQANPALGDFLDPAHLRATVRTTREAAFRRYHLNQWVSGHGAWLPFGAWDVLARPTRKVRPGERVVLAFDGSASGDSTALVGCTLADPHLFVVDVWENPGDPRWRVPRGEVDATVARAFDRYDVAELACDPWGWRSEIEAWTERHERVVEWPTNIATRIAPATDRLYQAITAGTVTHDADPRLARHVANCAARPTPHGDLVTKDRRMSPRKIDAAVAAVVAFDRAAHHAARRPRRRRMLVAR